MLAASPEAADAAVSRYSVEISRFFTPDGPPTLTFYYQRPSIENDGASPVLYLADPEVC